MPSRPAHIKRALKRALCTCPSSTTHARALTASPLTSPDLSDYEHYIVHQSNRLLLTSSNVQTFLNKLRAPRRSELTRKRKVRVTSSGYRKKKPACSTDPTSVSPTHRARDFPHECLIVSAGKLFCSACREELSLKRSIVKAHVECSKHKRSKEAIGQKYLSILKENQHNICIS